MFKRKYLLIIVSFLLFFLNCGLVVASSDPAVQRSDDKMERGYIRLAASIMTIDALHGKMMVAEREIMLPMYLDTNGIRRYRTSFLDLAGREIGLSKFRVRDDVVVEGVELPDGSIVARSIIRTSN